MKKPTKKKGIAVTLKTHRMIMEIKNKTGQTMDKIIQIALAKP